MNKVIIAGIVIVILGLISFLAIGFVNNSNQILEERNNRSAELQKLKESSVEDVMFNKLIVGYGTKGGDDVERIAGTNLVRSSAVSNGSGAFAAQKRSVMFVPNVAFGLISGRDLTMEAQRRNELQAIHLTGTQKVAGLVKNVEATCRISHL